MVDVATETPTAFNTALREGGLLAHHSGSPGGAVARRPTRRLSKSRRRARSSCPPVCACSAGRVSQVNGGSPRAPTPPHPFETATHGSSGECQGAPSKRRVTLSQTVRTLSMRRRHHLYSAKAFVRMTKRRPVGGCNVAGGLFCPPSLPPSSSPQKKTRAAGAKVWADVGRASGDVPKLVPFVARTAVVIFAPEHWLGQLSVLADAVKVYTYGRDASLLQLPF